MGAAPQKECTVTLSGANRRSPAAWLAAAMATPTLLAGLFLLMVFSDGFHDYEHRRLGTEGRLGAVHADELVDDLQAYFLSFDGALLRHPYLSYRERLHYLEVKQVMQGVLGVFLVSALATLGTLGWVMVAARRRQQPLRAVASQLLRNLAWLLLATITAGIFLALNFERSFVALHRLLFEGGNWILPTYSVTARVFPAEYFFDFFLVYSALFTVAGAALAGALIAVER